jgi:TPR repeat protein/DNA-binding transcriptional ArsR family regulator
MRLLENIYHTDNASDEEIVANFTVRKLEFNKIITALGNQEKKGLQNFLLIGKRGMGKSTLLRRIDIELKKEAYKQDIITIRLGGEGYRMSKLFKLWEQIIDILSINVPKLKEAQKKIDDSKEYEQNLILIITEYLDTTNKRLLLLIDNFDTLIKNFTTKEQHILRETLIQYPIQIIGNTLFYEETFFSYNQPFYDFFQIIKLKNLSKEESIEFINAILEMEKQNGNTISENKKLSTISTLRVLSGGVPRTIIFLLSVLFDDSVETTIEHLKKLNELVTPLYQDRMNHLSPQQKEIVWAMAMQWDKVGVKEIAKKMRLESKSVSAQLKVLEQNGYINKVDIPGRTHYYLIDERYFNIWLLMSEGSAYDGKRVLWLTKSLDMLLDESEIQQYAKKCLTSIKEPENKFFFMQAFMQSDLLSSSHKLDLLNEYLEDDNLFLIEGIEWIKKMKEKLVLETNEVREVDEKMDTIENKVFFEEEIKRLLKNGSVQDIFKVGLVYQVELKDYNMAEKYYLEAAKRENISAMNNLGVIYRKGLVNYDKAEKYYRMAIEKGHVGAINNLGLLFADNLKDYKNAEKYYRMAIENGHIGAINNLGNLYRKEFKDYENAEKYYRMAIEKGHIGAINNLGLLFADNLKDYKNAEKYYRMAIENGHIEAINNLGNLYRKEFKDYENAEKYYRMAIERGHIGAINNLGLLFAENVKDFKKAEQLFLRAADKGDTRGLNNLGVLYRNEMKDYSKAEKYFLQAVKHNNNTLTLNNLGNLYKDKLKDYEKAEKYYRLGIEKKDTNAAINLGLLYCEKNEHKEYVTTLIEKYTIYNFNESQKLAYIIILLWSEKIIEALQIIETFNFISQEGRKNVEQYFPYMILYAIVFKQKHAVYKLFVTNEWMKDMYKPYYFALLTEMKVEKEKEYLTMPPELEEPVQLLLKEIESNRKKYGI